MNDENKSGNQQQSAPKPGPPRQQVTQTTETVSPAVPADEGGKLGNVTEAVTQTPVAQGLTKEAPDAAPVPETQVTETVVTQAPEGTAPEPASVNQPTDDQSTDAGNVQRAGVETVTEQTQSEGWVDQGNGVMARNSKTVSQQSES